MLTIKQEPVKWTDPVVQSACSFFQSNAIISFTWNTADMNVGTQESLYQEVQELQRVHLDANGQP